MVVCSAIQEGPLVLDINAEMSRASHRYKWGATATDELQCKIEVPTEGEQPKGKRLRQQPFATIRDLLPSLMRYTVKEADLNAIVRRMQRMF